MRILTFSSLYPNAEQPSHGIFVEQRLRQLLRYSPIETRVVAPVPWFPFQHSCFGKYGKFARIPDKENRHDIDVLHPRYLLLPKIGMNIAPWFMAAGLQRNLRKRGTPLDDFDLIDAHYFYPDGVAAAILAKALGKPLLITARGTDINLIPKYNIPRRWILWAANQAKALITVCQALKDELVSLGVSEKKITVLRNGVDLDFFCETERESNRKLLGLSRSTIMSVGHLVERKGHDLVIQSLLDVPETDLLIVGAGQELKALQHLTTRLGLDTRVRFIGEVSQADLKKYYSAADVLVLASSREGWPNVLLESMACGTPVVATNVWGSPEVVTKPEAGRLVEERTPACIAKSIKELLKNYPSRIDTRCYAEQFSWSETSQGQIELFREIIT